MIHTHSTGGVIQNKNGQVVVVSQWDTSWSLPKGHIEENEDLLDTARREIREETGLTQLKLIKQFDNYERNRLNEKGEIDDEEIKEISMFLFTTDEDKLHPIDPMNPKAKWVDKDKVCDLLTHPIDKEFFDKILNELL